MWWILFSLIGTMASAQQPAATPAPPEKQKLEYSGKPLALQGECADAEIAEFGLECSEDEPCPIYLELGNIEAVGLKLFLTGNFHTSSATLWSILLMSEDGGKSWTEPAERFRGASLDLIQFIDFENGWTSGEIAGSLPKDPFFLKTADGGKTWRRSNVFDDTSYGVVDQFWFDSKTHGMMVLYRKGNSQRRYQRLETMTGGDSWMTREVVRTAPPALRPKNPGGSDYRVRADNATKSYRIEKREGARWGSLSAFQVAGGTCKPAVKPPPPPPSPPQQ